MIVLSRRHLLAIAAIVDVALHARPDPVAAKALAARHNLPPRHLETLLQALVRAGLLKGVRGPRGGYELARERRKITLADIVRASMAEPEAAEATASELVEQVVAPAVAEAGQALLERLDGITVDDLCRRAAETGNVPGVNPDFTI